MSWRDFVQNNKKYWMEYLAGLVYFITILIMVMGIALGIMFLANLNSEAQAQDYSQVREYPNVWANECETCHPASQDLAKETGIQTEQYLFNFVYEHTNKEGKRFGQILSKSEIDFVSRFVLIAAYLHKLETDMRKAGDHLQKNIRL
jgi:hypothetical protein